MNSIIRLQCRRECNASTTNIYQREVGKLVVDNEIVPTEISYEFIVKNPWLWQSHLERISDFLLDGNCWFQGENGVIFNDTQAFKHSTITLHHYRSSNFQSEIKYLQECWVKCVQTPAIIPAEKIKVEYEDGENTQVTIITCNSLAYFKDTPAPTETNFHSDVNMDDFRCEVESTKEETITATPDKIKKYCSCSNASCT